MKRIPVVVAPGKTITLSPGGQNILVKQITDEFCGRFTPGGELVYVGDTDEKWAYFNEELLAAGWRRPLGLRSSLFNPYIIISSSPSPALARPEAATFEARLRPKGF